MPGKLSWLSRAIHIGRLTVVSVEALLARDPRKVLISALTNKEGARKGIVLLSDLPGVTVKVLRSTADLYGEIRFNLHLAPRTIIDM